MNRTQIVLYIDIYSLWHILSYYLAIWVILKRIWMQLIPRQSLLDNNRTFWQMLRNSSGSSGPRGWGMAASKPRVPPSPSPPRHTIDSDGESAPAPGYHQSFSDAIAIALQHASEQKGQIYLYCLQLITQLA